MRIRTHILLLLFLSFSASAQLSDEQLENLDVYLHTVDVGNLVYDNFGHTAVRVHDKSSGQDNVFNWGIFDMSDPVEFSYNFYKGIMIYRLGIYPYSLALEGYQREKRTVWEDKLNLSPAQKRILLKRLYWNSLPENRSYPYHYFFNNCATIVRDYFDEALSSQLQENTKQQMAGRTFRHTVQQGYSTNPVIQFPLDVIMNSNIDREMSNWEQMFLPIYLRQELLKFKDKDGRSFIESSKLLYESPSPQPFLLSSFQLMALVSLIGCGLLWLAFKKEKYVIVRWLFIPFFLFALLLTIMGVMMPANWLFSAHIDLYHNVNMLLLWPTDFLLLWPMLLIIFKADKMKFREKLGSFLQKYVKVHLIVNGLFLIIGLLGVLKQDISNMALYLAPIYSLLLLITVKVYENFNKPAD